MTKLLIILLIPCGCLAQTWKTNPKLAKSYYDSAAKYFRYAKTMRDSIEKYQDKKGNRKTAEYYMKREDYYQARSKYFAELTGR